MGDGERASLTGSRSTSTRKKILVIVAIAVSQTCATQLTSVVVKVQSAEFLVWFSTGFNLLLLPVALAAARSSPTPPCTWRQASSDLLLALPFFFLWGGANLLYVESLAGLSPPLVSAQRYYWKVRAWDGQGRVRESAPAWWGMGLLEAADWHGAWIGQTEDVAPRPAPMRRR